MTKRILVVEDQEDSRRILSDLLNTSDYEVTEAGQILTLVALLPIGLFDAKRIAAFPSRSTRMRKVLRGYAKDKNGNLILIGTMPVPFNKDKCAPAVRREKRHLVRQGATIFRHDFFEALHLLAVVQSELGRSSDAFASYGRALAIRPDNAQALHNRGLLFQKLKRFEEALASYEKALAVRPREVATLYNHGNTLRELKRFDEALASYEKVIALKPDYAAALFYRGNILQELKRFDEALASYDRALRLRPDFPEALVNRGFALHELKRFDEALACHDRALRLRPDFPEALVNRGTALHHLKRFDEELASYDRALRLRPDYDRAHFNEAACRLLIGDFDRGLEKLEWRPHKSRNFAQPIWLGSNEITGKAILLHTDDWLGFGDMMQFCRYVPLVAERAARVILEVQPPLRELMNTLAGGAQIVSEGDPLPDFDMRCPVYSLPLAFKTRLETIPSATPYLRASSQAINEWSARLGRTGRPRIGLAWSSNIMYIGPKKSMGLPFLLPLLDINATFISMQQEVPVGDATVLTARSELLHFGNELKNFSDTAALISNLDLVISVDTSVAHLAGALGKPVWVMLPFISNWRWLLDRDDSPWYPTARLFRQDDSRTWDSVIARVHAALQDFVRNYASTRTPG
jgi:tetratricopeptide (TPR) repeat protein